jgi:hypothetical protein
LKSNLNHELGEGKINDKLIKALSKIKPYLSLEVTQANLIIFEKCVKCYKEKCFDKDQCNDNIAQLLKLSKNSKNNKINTILRMLYNIRQNNINIIEVDFQLSTTSLDELASKYGNFSDSNVDDKVSIEENIEITQYDATQFDILFNT